MEYPDQRIRVDSKSRNTRENALQSRALLADVRGPVLLVTSSYHMPCALACFSKVGLKVIAWPTDYQRTTISSVKAFIPSPAALQLSEAALHEYLGWLTYWVADLLGGGVPFGWLTYWVAGYL